MAQDIYKARVNARAIVAPAAFGVANLYVRLSARLLSFQASTDHDSKDHRRN